MATINDKIKKLTLKRFNDNTQTWTTLYPKTSGDQIEGQVDDSLKLDGKTSDRYMPSTFANFMEIVDDAKKPQGIAANRIVITNDYNTDEQKVLNNQLYVKGKAFILNGQEVATQNDVDKMISKTTANILASKVNASVLADRLSASPSINDVLFDGSQSIHIQCFTISSVPPSDHTKLWINEADHTINYYYNNKWCPCTAVYDEDK